MPLRLHTPGCHAITFRYYAIAARARSMVTADKFHTHTILMVRLRFIGPLPRLLPATLAVPLLAATYALSATVAFGYTYATIGHTLSRRRMITPSRPLR